MKTLAPLLVAAMVGWAAPAMASDPEDNVPLRLTGATVVTAAGIVGVTTARADESMERTCAYIVVVGGVLGALTSLHQLAVGERREPAARRIEGVRSVIVGVALGGLAIGLAQSRGLTPTERLAFGTGASVASLGSVGWGIRELTFSHTWEL